LQTSYLLILGHRAGLEWVLENSRMAFTAARAKDGALLAVGDRLFLYTSRGCFGNPTRDRGRVIGEAHVTSPVRARAKPVEIAGREFTHECEIALQSLAPSREGVVLADLVSRLDVFTDERSWSARLRRPLLPLTPKDARLVAVKLRPITRPATQTIRGYLDDPTPGPARLSRSGATRSRLGANRTSA
jgi:hypothetical protein